VHVKTIYSPEVTAVVRRCEKMVMMVMMMMIIFLLLIAVRCEESKGSLKFEVAIEHRRDKRKECLTDQIDATSRLG